MNGIEFEVKGSAASAERTLNSLSNTLSRLKAATRGGLGLSNISSGMKSIAKNKVTQLIDAEKITKDLLSVDRTIARVNKSIADSQKAASMKGATQAEIEQATDRIKEYQKQLAGLYEKRTGIVDGSRYAPPTDAISKWERLRDVISSVLRGTGKGIGFAAKGIWAVTKGIGTVAISPIKNAIGSVGNFAESLGSVISGFKRIVFYRLIRAIIKEISEAFQEGVKHVYEWSRAMRDAASGDLGRFADNMDDLATSLAYFKNSVGAAVAPLANVLAPAIRVVTDAAVELLNVINQVFALLTGQSSWTRAIRNATEYGDAVGGAGGRAKEALKYLAPFDELNVLPDEKSGGGGGGAAEDFSSMFEEVTEFSEAIGDFATKLKDAFENADWQELGTLLGEKVNSLLGQVDFAGIGQSVGEKINGWFTTKYWTLDTINFQNIGADVAKFLEDALDEIDFETIGKGVVQKYTIVGDLIIGFVTNLDWGKVASDVGSYIKGAFEGAADWLQEQDWTEIGGQVWEGIKGILSEPDWSGTAKAIMEALGAALNAALRFLWGVLTNIGSDIADWWTNNISADTFAETASNLWAAFKEALGDVGKWIEENIFSPFIEGLTGMPWEDLKSTMRQLFGLPEIAPEEDRAGLLEEREAWEGRDNRGEYTGLAGSENSYTSTYNALHAPANAFAQEFLARLGPLSQQNPPRISSVADIKETRDNRSTDRLNFVANLTGTVDNIKQRRLQKFTANVSNFVDNISAGGKQRRLQSFTANVSSFVDNISAAGGKRRLQSFTANVSNFVDNISAGGGNRRLQAFTASVSKFVDNISPGDTSKRRLTAFTAELAKVSNAEKAVNNAISPLKPSLKVQANVVGLKDTYNAKLKFAPELTETSLTVKIKSGDTTQHQKIEFVQEIKEQYASGGFPSLGQLFLAREAGPELVGRIGGRTAVMNNDQIVASVSAGVARAMSSVRFQMTGYSAGYDADGEATEDMLYRAFQRALSEADIGGDVSVSVAVDPEKAYQSVVRRNAQETYRTGVNPLIA